MENASSAVPTLNSPNHGNFDAHFLRAIGQEGYSRWFRRPKVEATTLTLKDVRMQVQKILESNMGPFPGKRLLPHLAFVLTEASQYLHLASGTTEDVLLEVRLALIQTWRGEFLIDQEKDPLYMYAKSAQRINYTTGMMQQTHVLKATTEEKAMALSLIGSPNILEDITRGTITEALRNLVPHLLSVDTSECEELAQALRTKLHEIIGQAVEFTPAMRVQCIDAIMDYWNTIQPSGDLEEAIEKVMAKTNGGDPLDISPKELIDQYLNPVLKNPIELRERLPILETATFNHALPEASEKEAARISAIWEVIFPNTGLAICDKETNMLAFLAAIAKGRTMEKFREQLGPAPVIKSPLPSEASSSSPDL